MSRLSPGLRRQLRLTARAKESQDIATFLRGVLATWPGCPLIDEARGTGSGSVSFDAVLCGRRFTVRIEPRDATESPAVPAGRGMATADAGRSGGGNGGD
jgi:hypothetical protein